MLSTEELINSELFDKIPNKANIAIYGTNNIAAKICHDINLKRKDVNIICYLEMHPADNFENKPVHSIKELIEKNFGINFIIVTRAYDCMTENILDTYNIPFLTISSFISDYYEGKHEILNEKTYKEVIDIFKEDEDKKLFDIIFRRRKRIDDDRFLAQHYFQKYKNLTVNRTIKNQYLDKINKDCIYNMLDLGFNSGFNAIAYTKLLPNLKMIYAFEAIYDICKDNRVEDFLDNDKINIVKYAIGNSKSKTQFYVNLSNPNASMTTFSNSKPDKHITDSTHKIIDVDVTTIDDFCSTNNIKPDFIKMDIEGAELPALIGGLETIKNSRPQMAISIYHCDSDFINIPKYLYQNLDNYKFNLGHYSPDINETVLYALPE